MRTYATLIALLFMLIALPDITEAETVFIESGGDNTLLREL
jgi:hypothetical protein